MAPSALGSRAFPKISGKASDFLDQLKTLKRAGKLPMSHVDIEGTVKLHGMHADIVFDISSTDTTDSIIFQSRNRECAPDASQHGWPCNIAQHESTLKGLRDQVLVRHNELNPNQDIDSQHPLIIAGEWIGPKVQKDVGVSELSHRLVILTIQINGVWQHDLDYADIEAPEAAIFNVQRVPPYHVRLDLDDLSMENPALIEMQRLADEAEKCCPFAAAFGIENSMGEGIVWKPNIPEARNSAKYWLKTKGPKFGPENRIRSSNSSTGQITPRQAAKKWLTERRIEQGFEYLAEMQTAGKARFKVFKQWVTDDILLEEATEFELLKQQPKFEKSFQNHLTHLLSDAFHARINAERKESPGIATDPSNG